MKSVSVIIPAYNREHTIKECIQSVFAQNVDNLEIIVVDDGSSDGTEAKVKSLGDARIIYFKQANKGANAARNAGLEMATGHYVALLDSDDKFCDGHLKRSITALEKEPQAVAFARILVDRGNEVTALKPPRGPRPDEEISEYLSCDKGFIQTSTLVIPAALAKRIRYLNWLPYGQDVDFACRIAEAGYKFIYFDTPGAIWSDISDAKRISAKSDPKVRMQWALENRNLLTAKAYSGFVGWRVAKAYAENGQMIRGLSLFFNAITQRAFPARHALTVFLQIILAGGTYRKIADKFQKYRPNGKSAPY